MASAATCLPIIPTFVLPYKRYAGPTLLNLAATYVESEKRSYRQTVSPKGRTTGYQTLPGPSGAAAIDERALAHSTVWRILTWLGNQWAALAAGRKLLLARHPTSTCHRFLGAVTPQKFRSRQREQLLRQSRQLLHLISEWEGSFPEKFFPRFATRSGFG